MKIDNTGKNTLTQPPRTGGRPVEEASKPAGNAVQDSVTLNPVAAQISQGDETGSTFDSARVASLRQAIAEGRFSVRPDAIADKLLNSVKELLSE
ncbi:flagellar biosynthesis anti-sigma factor FlgM [Chitiniphilus eburneus]|uniref:Negative regulator of flagellin synthesis n=1 Tax=Chitiniphilus eburneus TaxID=2571148 RepID=A0A4U0Q264_9NEIS|nr:flagellar biosynthesis anti-sigma factor FlgM [Chitiniphilus eburneus]TJZ69784.1 flagellar biosynthesis anti-sigma factor FlgM [Chitiniphilus eburneus]